MAQGKALAVKNEDLSLDSQNPWKRLCAAVQTPQPQRRTAEIDGLLGLAAGPAKHSQKQRAQSSVSCPVSNLRCRSN